MAMLAVIFLLMEVSAVAAWVWLESKSVTSMKSYGPSTFCLSSSSSSTDELIASVIKSANSTIFNLSPDAAKLKREILQLGAALDRGQAYNPTSGSYYKEKMDYAKSKVLKLASYSTGPINTLAELSGEWELVFSSVPHGIFRSSPFFLAIQEAYNRAGEPDKSQLFFKLHELQTMSWGISKVGRVAQIIDAEKQVFVSEFDTSIFSMTVLPLLGWFKLLPTFGGTVVTVSNVSLAEASTLKLVVDYTTSRPVKGLNGVLDSVWSQRVPVNAIWKRLPWNKGEEPTATLKVLFCDDEFRIMQDVDGEVFVYTRPVFTEEVEL